MKKVKTDLRDRVQKEKNAKADLKKDFSTQNPAKLIAELRTHQIELEMQNEALFLAHEETQKIQAKYIDLYDFAPVGYLSLRGKEKIFEANLTAAKLFDIEKSLLKQSSFTDFVDFNSQDVFYFHLKKVRMSNTQESCELKLCKFSGETFFARLESVAVHLGRGIPIEIRISIININENKMNLMALKESAERNEMLLNLLPQPAILISKNRKVLAANRLAKKNGAAVGDFWTNNSQIGLPKLNEHSAQTVDFLEKNELPPVSCLVDDNHLQHRLFTVVDDSNDAISLLDLQGNIKAWNRRAEELYGYSTSEALKRTIFDLTPSCLRLETEQLLKDICAGVLIKPFETKRTAQDGSILDISLKVTRMVQDGKIVAITTTERDVTDHNRIFASLQELPGRIIMAQEKERSRISQVLHSEFGQSLISLKLFTSIAASEFSFYDTKLASVFTQIKAQLDKIVNDTRNLAHELSPPGLRYAGLIPAIKNLTESAMQNKNLKISFFHKNVDQASLKDNEIIIYRIIQEALQNVIKHGYATSVQVKAICTNDLLTIEIIDNGRGFNPSKASSCKGLGLALMKEQASLILGFVTIRSQPGKGTSIKLSIPVKEKK